MYFLVGCQFIIVLAMASTPARLNTTVVSGSPNQRFANELSNRSSHDPFLDYINPEEKRKRGIQSCQEETPTELQRSISMTLEQLLIERPNASSSFDYRAKKQEITTADTNRTKTDDRGSRFFVNQMLERGGNEERPLTDLNERSVTENRKELLQPESLSLKKRATGNSTPESSSRKETTEILNRKIDVRSHSTPDLQDKEIPLTGGLKPGKESRQLSPELFEVVQPLHQQTTNSKPIRTQHLKQSKRTAEEDNTPQALPLHRFNPAHQIKHLVTPLSARPRKRKSRFSRQNSAQLNAAVAYQRALQSLQIGSTDHSNKAPVFGLNQPQFRFNPTQTNAIREGFNPIQLIEENFRKVPSKQVAFIPPKIIYETKILPAPFMTDDRQQKDFRDYPNFFTRVPDSRGNEFDFTSSNGQQHTSIPIKDVIPVTEKVHELETSFTTPEPEPENALPANANEFSNHRYETAVPIIKSIPLNHKPYSENVDETKDTPQLEYSELVASPEFSHSKEHLHNRLYAGKYTYGYRVSDHETGNDFGHEERRDGDITRGRYHVLLPDGRIQNVKYHVDHQGYHAKVSYHYDH